MSNQESERKAEALGSDVERRVRRCDRCRFWMRLVDTKESYGLCLWYTQRPEGQVIPMWMKAMIRRFANDNPPGALPPDGGNTCEAFLGRTPDAQRMQLTGPAVGQGDTMSQDETKAGSELSGRLGMAERGPAAQALIDFARKADMERNALKVALQKIHDQPNCRFEVEAQLGGDIWDLLYIA